MDTDMKKLFVLFLIALLGIEIVAAKVFYYADEVDRRSNVNFALSHPFSGVDVDRVGDFDKYACISLNDYNNFASAGKHDSYNKLDAKTIGKEDLKRLRREDQMRIADENPYDNIDREDFDDTDDLNCYTLRDYNALAHENSYDNRELIDFTDFDHLQEVKKIGRYRYNNFFVFPDDFKNFNLQYTTNRPPYYEPYEFRRSHYPLYGYGIVRREDY